MRKAYISIAALLLCGSMLMAQTPANRTAKTTAADVLAQMPAAKQAAYNKLIGDLSSTGEEGVTSAPGVFAAGDIRTKALRQVVTAVSDGANAVASAQKYLWRTDNGNH